MSDLDIIRRIEKELGVELEQVDRFELPVCKMGLRCF